MGIKAVFKDWLPPVVLRKVQKGRRYLKQRQVVAPTDLPEWEFVPGGWNASLETIGGWDQPGVAETYARKWPGFVERIAGTQPLGVNHEALDGAADDCFDTHNQVMTLAYVVGRLARHRDRLRVFDFGGALGHHLAFLQVLFPDLAFEYSCRETPRVAAEGQKLHPQVRFVADDAWTTQSFDLVMASNSFQYVRDWRALLAQFARSASSTVFITKLPVVRAAPSGVVLQRAWKYGYHTEYLGWCLNRGEFLDAARGSGLRLLREFLVFHHEPSVVGAMENFRHLGFLFQKEVASRGGVTMTERGWLSGTLFGAVGERQQSASVRPER